MASIINLHEFTVSSLKTHRIWKTKIQIQSTNRQGKPCVMLTCHWSSVSIWKRRKKLKNISFDAKVWTAAGRCPKKVWWHGLAQHGWIDSWSKPCEMYWASNTYGIRKLYLMAFVMLLFVENWDVAAYRLFQRDFNHGSWWQMCQEKNGRDHMTSTYHLLPKPGLYPHVQGCLYNQWTCIRLTIL